VASDAAKSYSGRRLLIAMLVVFVAAVVPAVFVPTLACRPEAPQLDDLGVVPPFQLVDERGQTFTEEALRGHPTVVSFIFTRCDTICPVTTMKMRGIQDKTFDAGRKLKLVSITVDPEYDTPQRLEAYARKHEADDTRWRFVTGPVAQVKALVEGPFMNSMKRGADLPSGAPSIGHSGYFLLVDGDLHIRGAYDSGDITRLDTLMRDARYLVRTRK
jgi:protein SCO1